MTVLIRFFIFACIATLVGCSASARQSSSAKAKSKSTEMTLDECISECAAIGMEADIALTRDGACRCKSISSQE